MKLNIKGLNKTALFLQLYNHIQVNFEGNEKKALKTLEEAEKLLAEYRYDYLHFGIFADLSQDEVNTDQYNNFYGQGMGLFETFVAILRREENSKIIPKLNEESEEMSQLKAQQKAQQETLLFSAPIWLAAPVSIPSAPVAIPSPTSAFSAPAISQGRSSDAGDVKSRIELWVIPKAQPILEYFLTPGHEIKVKALFEKLTALTMAQKLEIRGLPEPALNHAPEYDEARYYEPKRRAEQEIANFQEIKNILDPLLRGQSISGEQYKFFCDHKEKFRLTQEKHFNRVSQTALLMNEIIHLLIAKETPAIPAQTIAMIALETTAAKPAEAAAQAEQFAAPSILNKAGKPKKQVRFAV